LAKPRKTYMSLEDVRLFHFTMMATLLQYSSSLLQGIGDLGIFVLEPVGV
jgi:hypothetical protein